MKKLALRVNTKPGADTAPAAIEIHQESADGFILVAVLWILGGLATLVAIYSLYVINAATSLEVNHDRIHAEASVSAGLELTAYYLSAVEVAAQPTRGSFSFQIGNSNVTVGFRSEAARIDLNTAPKALLAGLFRVLGAQPEAADYYADRIIGWRTNAAIQNEDQDPEITAYRTAGLRYNPRQAAFANVQELWLVLGLPPAMIERAMPFFTVFSGLPTVNVMDSAPEVVAALPDMSPERLDAVLNERNKTQQDARSVLQLLGPAQTLATLEGSKATRVTVQVDLAKGRRINAEAVILLLEDADDPYRVLSWTDDFDGQMAYPGSREGLR
jgi:general secretion pathway protein K